MKKQLTHTHTHTKKVNKIKMIFQLNSYEFNAIQIHKQIPTSLTHSHHTHFYFFHLIYYDLFIVVFLYY